MPLSVFGARTFSSVDVNIASLGGESISEGTLMEWKKSVGEAVAKDEVIALIETDKVTIDVNAPVAGTITEILAEVDATVKVGDLVAKIAAGEGAAAAAAPKPAAAAPAASAPVAGDDHSLTANLAARAAERDGKTPAPAAPAAAPAAKPAEKAPEAAPVKEFGARTERREKMSRMRLRIAQRLKEAQDTTAMLTTFQECDMTGAMAFRKEYKDEFEKVHGLRFGFMSIFTKACALALQEVPAINGVIDDAAKQIVYRDYVDISIAVASPRGLVVPVLRNAEGMTLKDIEAGIAELAKKAKNDTITPDDMAGGTFTISNGGVFGSLFGTPIINPPQTAILGMHAIKDMPRAVGGQVLIRPIMYLALTYDHRLVDGREAVTFLVSVKNKVEDPRRMLLGL